MSPITSKNDIYYDSDVYDTKNKAIVSVIMLTFNMITVKKSTTMKNVSWILRKIYSNDRNLLFFM